MNISLSDALKDFVEQQVSQRGYSTISDYVRELIRKDQERQALRGHLRACVTPSLPSAYSAALQERILRRARAAAE
ncbi:MAG: ribbon-helix-helix domain-containing protein [Pseudomonadota bacterium]